MTDTRYKIVFTGELMPGAALDAVKDNLARLFKSDRSKIDALFTGNPVALKRDLNEGEADKYVGALQNAGAKVSKEPDLSASLSLVETDDHRPSAPAPSAPAPSAPLAPSAPHASHTDATRMTCPKCGHEQDKAIECSACGIIIEKYLARQAQLAEAEVANSTPAVAIAAAPAGFGAATASPYATPHAQVGEALPEYGELNYFNVEGRIGRARYLGWSMGMVLLAIPVFAVLGGISALSAIFGGLLSLIAVVGLTVFSVFIGAKRLHDLGWSAWLWLVLLIPIVGGVFSLVMLVVPGNEGPNRYGPPPPPNSKGVLILAWSVLVVPVLIGILAALAIPAYQDYTNRAAQSEYSQPSADMAEPAQAVEPAEPDTPADEADSDEQ